MSRLVLIPSFAELRPFAKLGDEQQPSQSNLYVVKDMSIAGWQSPD